MTGFESGDLSTAPWGSSRRVTVSSVRASSGDYSARFEFEPSTTGDAFAELRFDLHSQQREIWIRYDLYIPSNYSHRDAPSSDNNKFFRLWGSDYDSPEKVGASLWPTSANGSRLAFDWNTGNGIGPKGDRYGLISEDDLGRWMAVKVHALAATSERKGSLRLWKNGNLVLDASAEVDNFSAGEPHSYRKGYLLGWSNSGFSSRTFLHIDDVVFATEEADLEGIGLDADAGPGREDAGALQAADAAHDDRGVATGDDVTPFDGFDSGDLAARSADAREVPSPRDAGVPERADSSRPGTPAQASDSYASSRVRATGGCQLRRAEPAGSSFTNVLPLALAIALWRRGRRKCEPQWHVWADASRRGHRSEPVERGIVARGRWADERVADEARRCV